MNTKVETYYDANPQQEWDRLERHRTEFALTMRALKRYLPGGAAILDDGGGPGRYAIALTEAGHRVTLLDLSQGNLALAQAKAAERGVQLAGLVHGNALDLNPFQEAQFDAVLMMGPLYHLLEESERARAVRESLRVLKPGGLLVTSVITRYAAIRDMAAWEPEKLPGRLQLMRRLLETGVFQSPGAGAFTDFYCFRVFELAPWLESFDLTTLEQLGQEGIISEIEERVNGLNGEAWEAWVEINEQGGRDPAMWGQAGHLLHIGRRAQGPGSA